MKVLLITSSKERSNSKQFYTVTSQPSRQDQSSFRGGTQVQNPAGISQALHLAVLCDCA